MPELQLCPFCAEQHAKPFDTPLETAPTPHSPELTHHLMRAVSAAAAGAQAPLAAAAGEEEQPRGGGAAGWTPGAVGGTTPPAIPLICTTYM